MHQISHFLLFLRRLKTHLCCRNIIRHCLHGLLKLFAWIKRLRYRLIRQENFSDLDGKQPLTLRSVFPVQSEDTNVAVVACSYDASAASAARRDGTEVIELTTVGYALSSPSQVSIERLGDNIAPFHQDGSDSQHSEDIALSPTDCEQEPFAVEISFSHPNIRPFAPEMLARYDRGIEVPRERKTYKIAPFTTSFHKKQSIAGWTPVCHPEGALYFFHPARRVFTDADLYDNETLLQIRSDIDAIDDFFRARNFRRSADIDLVLERSKDEDGLSFTQYYLADHSRRSIFYVDEFDVEGFSSFWHIMGMTSSSHLEHEIQAQYCFRSWYLIEIRHHCSMFPRALSLKNDHVHELQDILVHAMGDTITSITSTVPYGVEDLQKMLGLVNHLGERPQKDLQGSVCVLSRLMYVFARQRFYDFHGQPGARLERDKSVHGDTQKPRSWLITCASPILFFAPEVHLKALERMWIDEKLRQLVWSQVMTKLCSEWQEFTLYGTVLLNANVAFLAIQSVDQYPNTRRSAAQIASYASVLASIGCIILALLLERQNRTKARETAREAAEYMLRKSNQALGMETLAIMYSLPYAFLLWGMVTFLVAFLFNCFSKSTEWTWMLVGAASLALVGTTSLCIWMAWESQQCKVVAEVEIPETSSSKGKESEAEVEPTKSVLLWRCPTFPFRRRTCDSDATVV